MTIKRVVEKMRETPGVSAMAVNRVEALLSRFATPEAFFAASKGELLKQWHDMGNDRDLGDKFYEAFDLALQLYRTEDEGIPSPADRKFTKDDLKGLVDMMELMDVPAMDASEMAFVLDLRRKDPAK